MRLSTKGGAYTAWIPVRVLQTSYIAANLVFYRTTYDPAQTKAGFAIGIRFVRRGIVYD